MKHSRKDSQDTNATAFMGTASDKRDKPGRPGRQSPGRVTTVWRVLAQQKNQTTTMRRYYWRNSSANLVRHVANCTQNYTAMDKEENSELIHAELTPSRGGFIGSFASNIDENPEHLRRGIPLNGKARDMNPSIDCHHRSTPWKTWTSLGMGSNY